MGEAWGERKKGRGCAVVVVNGFLLSWEGRIKDNKIEYSLSNKLNILFPEGHG